LTEYKSQAKRTIKWQTAKQQNHSIASYQASQPEKKCTESHFRVFIGKTIYNENGCQGQMGMEKSGGGERCFYTKV
jgi:hypothetical protein